MLRVNNRKLRNSLVNLGWVIGWTSLNIKHEK